LDAGAVNVTVAWAFPAVAATAVGAPGVVYGVTALEAVEALEVPTEFVAVTVKVYALPGVRPVTMCESDVVPALLSVPPAGLDVTV
jgi:hypothetical protein